MRTSTWLALLAPIALGWPLAENQAAAGPLSPLDDTFHYVQPPAISGCVSTNPFQIHYGYIGYGYELNGPLGGFVGFDVGEIPDSATLLSVRLCYYQFSSPNSDSGPYTTVVVVSRFPTSPESLYLAIQNGYAVTGIQATPNGWVRRPLASYATALVDSCRRTNERVCLGLREASLGTATAYGKGNWSPERCFLEVEYTTTAGFSDIVAISLVPASPFYRVDESLRVVGRLRNTGNRTAYDVPVRFYHGGASYDSALVSSIEPGESAMVVAVLPPVVSPATFEFGMCAAYENDWCRHNDTADLTAYVFPSGTTMGEYFEGGDSLPFPPRGWATFDVRGPSSWWSLQPILDRRAHTGRYYAFCGRELQGNPDDWLISPGLMPRLGHADSVGFFVSSNQVEADYVQVWALSGPTPEDTVQVLLSTQVLQNWACYTLCLDSFDGRTICIGFRKNHSGGWHGVSLDDVWFTSDLASGAEEQRPLQMQRLAIVPNPTGRGRVRLSYQLREPGPVDVTVSDILGRVVRCERVARNAANGSVPLDCRYLAAGVYYVSLRTATVTARGKLVVR